MLQLGKAIKLVRTAQEFSLSEVAKRAKVGIPFLSLVESEERQPSLETLRRIADALNIPPEALILLAQSKGGRLNTDDDVITEFANSVRRLADAEKSLRQKLSTHR